jgi:hypothetical protein
MTIEPSTPSLFIELRKSNGTLIDLVHPLTLPSPPNPGERIKVRGIKAVAMLLPLFMRTSITSRDIPIKFYLATETPSRTF